MPRRAWRVPGGERRGSLLRVIYRTRSEARQEVATLQRVHWVPRGEVQHVLEAWTGGDSTGA